MTTTNLEAGTASTYGFDLFSGVSGTAASVAGIGGFMPRAIKFTANQGSYVTLKTAGGSTGRMSFRFCGPEANSYQMANPAVTIVISYPAPNQTAGWCLRWELNGRLGIMNFTTSKTTTTAITGKSTPQRVSLAWNVVSSTNFTIKIFINGVLEVTATQADFSLGSGGSTTTGIGNGAANEMPRDVYLWDIYTDNDSSLTDPGDICVAAKLPARLNTNNFDTLGGSATNRWDYVSDRPDSDTNYIQHAAATDVLETFGLQGEFEGDFNLLGATIISRQAWWRAKRGDPPTRYLTAFSNFNKTAGTTLTVTVSGRSVGETVLISFAMDGATGTVSCTDNAGTPNTYVVDVDKAAASPGSTNARVCLIRAYLANVTSLTTITITHPSVTARAAIADVFVGIDQTTPLDKTNSAVGASTTPSTGATGVLSQANEVVFAAYAIETEGTYGAETGLANNGGADWTAGAGDASNMTAVAAYSLVGATTTMTGSRTGAANTDWAAAIATYKCSGGSLGTPKMVNDGVETSPSPALTTTPAISMSAFADGNQYPNNPAGIGMRSSASEADTFLYECGMLIAYLPGPPTHHHHKWGPTFSPVLSQ